jgi:hypothetical protein
MRPGNGIPDRRNAQRMWCAMTSSPSRLPISAMRCVARYLPQSTVATSMAVLAAPPACRGQVSLSEAAGRRGTLERHGELAAQLVRIPRRASAAVSTRRAMRSACTMSSGPRNSACRLHCAVVKRAAAEAVSHSAIKNGQQPARALPGIGAKSPLSVKVRAPACRRSLFGHGTTKTFFVSRGKYGPLA